MRFRSTRCAHNDDGMLIIVHPDLNIWKNLFHVFLNKPAAADRQFLTESRKYVAR